MDPICIETEEILIARGEVEKIIKYNPVIKSMHDFRIIGKGEHKNLIFYIVVDHVRMEKITTEDKLKKEITNSIRELHPQYNCVITVDRDFY